MTKTRLWAAVVTMLIIVAIVAVTPHAQAGKKHVKATLNGLQEDPSVSTPASGTFEATIDDDAQLIDFVFTYQGLEGGNSLFAHIHFGSSDHNGGVAAFLCGGSTKPTPCPNVQGVITGTIGAADVVGPTGQGIEPGAWGELVNAIRAGHTYANIHTTRWPGGEIRGQVNDADQRETRK
jgi:hypothetical protein